MITLLLQYSIITLLLLSSILASNSSIQGQVTDSNTNQYLMGANILLDGTMLGTASDENGYYIITNVPIGKYTLRVMFIGYESMEQEILIKGSQEYTVHIKLKPSAIELQETRVTAEKRKGKVTEAAASIEIISARDIKRESTTNIGSYLKGLKGVDFTSSGINNYSISIRGFNSSFNTRVLTLTDGRVANIPALRVINYSTVPQSMDDIDRMEVILGPATALYGANAHSGVVNIISKPPAQSEGLTMSVSGSNDERQLRKINGRWAKKLSDSFSIKLSGMYLHGYEWPYISETEYKSHLYPWTGNPYRMYDGKDNNPWNAQNEPVLIELTNDGRSVIIGNGEPNDTGDPDGDGVMGEDWYNGYDDDGDGKIDEDYFQADGVDNNNNCTGDTNRDGCSCCTGDIGVDENIDNAFDVWTDGYDNDGNGKIDDGREMYTNSSGTNYDPEWHYNLEERNIIIEGGRSIDNIRGEPNPWYIEGLGINNDDLKGNYYYDEEKVKYLFDIYIYDYGEDGIPGDPFIDEAGDRNFQLGECTGTLGGFIAFSECDRGLDGIPNTGDIGEQDGEWQPGDGWVDNGNGTVDIGVWTQIDNQWVLSGDTYIEPNKSDYIELGKDVWPLKNDIWDAHEEIIGDYGQDGIQNTGDLGEGDGILIGWDLDEKDGLFDTGDNIYGFQGDTWTDCNNNLSICENDANWDESMGNGKWDSNEEFIDLNGDNQYTPPDYTDNFQFVDDVNGDGLSEYPDFEVENRKVELRLDFDPSSKLNMTFQSGYSWTKTQQVTGTSRYLADGFEYKYYQLRGRYKNWYSQIYMNQSFSGNTRSYNQGNVIEDRSQNYAFQLQRNDDLKFINTKLVWGIDYFKTLPSTNGSILNDGPNGYDNDGDNIWVGYDLVDNDQDSDDFLDYGIDGYKWNDSWTIGEPNQPEDIYGNPLIDQNGDPVLIYGPDQGEGNQIPDPNEPGVNANGLIFADNRDNDGDGYIDENIDEKTCDDGYTGGRRDGKPWKCDEGIDELDEFINPESNEYGFYYQTKTELFGTSRFELITAVRWDNHDLLEEGMQFAPKIGFIYKPNEKSSLRFTYGKAYNTPNSITLYTDLHVRKQGIMDVYLRGNKEGTPYCRVGEKCSGTETINAATPGYYYCDGTYSENGECIGSGSSLSGDSLFHPISPSLEDDYFSGNTELPPYVDRVNGAPYFFNLQDGSAPNDMIPLDTSRYVIYVPELTGGGVLYTPEESFNIPNVDPIKTEKIQTLEIGYKGLIGRRTHLTVDYYESHYEDFFSPPTFITPLVVLRNDPSHSIQGILTVNDFQSNPPYGTAWNGLDDDGDWDEWADEFGWGETPDPGEWGFINYYDAEDSSNYIIYHPEEIVVTGGTGISFKSTDSQGNSINSSYFDAVGVDEYHPTVGLAEAEIILTGLIGENGKQLSGPGRAYSPPHLVLSPMNYGNVKMRGLDIGFTQLMPEHNLIIDGNISWYGTTEYYNKLTKKNDPINAPEWKWNVSVKWDSPMGELALNYRHVDKFIWNDGIWDGIIGPYDIFDFHYNYILTKNIELSISALNFMDDKHKELIGGAPISSQIIMRITSIF